MAIEYSRIIQGCMTLGKWGKKLDTSAMIEVINHCLDQGITSFDHADIYGDYSTEKEFGYAFAKAKIARSSIQLISKCGIQYVGGARPELTVKHYQYDADYIIWSAERSLNMLQTDYLDLFLLHRPSPLMEAQEVAKAFDQLKAQGKVRDFGVSNFTPSQVDLIQTATPLSANQIEFSLSQHSAMLDGTLDHMTTRGMLPMSWSPLGSVFREDTQQTERIKKVLANFCKKYDATEDQLLLSWVLKHPSGIHPVIGTTTLDRITNAVKAMAIELDREDWFTMLVASQGHKVP